MIIFKKSRRNSNDSIYCRACRNPVARVQDYIWRVRRAGIFSRVYNVLVSDDENYRLGSTIAKTYCGRCGTLLGWKFIVVPLWRELCFWNGVPLLHLNEEQDLGANDQNAHQDLGANEQNGDQDLGANEENADQDGGASEENADQDGDATDQDGDATDKDGDATDQDGVTTDQDGDATDQDGDTTDQDGDAIEQNADQDRDANEQDVGMNEENADPDGGVHITTSSWNKPIDTERFACLSFVLYVLLSLFLISLTAPAIQFRCRVNAGELLVCFLRLLWGKMMFQFIDASETPVCLHDLLETSIKLIKSLLMKESTVVRAEIQYHTSKIIFGWYVHPGGIFSRVYNVLVSDDVNYHFGSTIAKTYCSQCGTMIGWKFVRWSELSFWNGVSLLHLGANEQNADQDGDSTDQDEDANEQNVDQDGDASTLRFVLLLSVATFWNGVPLPHFNEEQDLGANEQNAHQDGDSTDQNEDANKQNAHQDLGANEENADQDGGDNEQNHDSDGGTPMN
ncbi:hypothetical protein MTR67_019786 [Solanum verrucosum]|uniref:Yippee domain-containing protein n=1 Tax=Solanum verrucosum TaxID=315347 RepID=A0AAF0QN90_SOLVR|nr:hypothetical protein MTR67_019786 [Solanum verrucosum]